MPAFKHYVKTRKWVLQAALLMLTASSLTTAIRQNPLKDPRICGRPQCDSGSKKFGYTDALYKYDYSIDLRTEFSGSGDNSSDLFIKASLDIFFPKPCEGYLRVTDVKLWDHHSTPASSEVSSTNAATIDYDYYGQFSETNSGGSSEESNGDFTEEHPKSNDLAIDLKKNYLRFAFHDGYISEVCPSKTEPVWVLNFKKGILSAFQNTMLRFDVDFNTTETDVSGQCNVQYLLESTDNVFVTIRKVKDIPSCRNRYSTHSILQTTPYAFRDDKTIWPVLNSQSYCNLTIDNSIYKGIDCYERHQLIPFSNSSTGAVTTSVSHLELKGEESYSSGEFLAAHDELIERRAVLLFDHTPAIKPTHGEIRAARDLLKEMCTLGFPNIQREFIDVFTNFLQTTKSLDYKALTQLLARSASICENGKNHVLESLPYVGSTASYQLMRDQIVANAVPKIVASNWMTSLSFIQRPDEETLETFYTIIDISRKKIDPDYTLCATAVIHSFCRHNADCGQNTHVQRITHLLEAEFLSLFDMYKNERRTRERMIVVLKGLGNIGVISQQFAKRLHDIISEEDMAPVDLRLHAVFSFRRADCVLYQPIFLNTYSNFSTNSEIRIAAYLQAMRCPNYQSIDKIKQVLVREEINQVGSFVWSHLKNLAKSSSPIRIEAQGLLLDEELSDKFRLDIRKFSRNYEHSIFFDEYNFGATTDMNLIFGMESFLPRMVTVNFTADLFGQSVNFFEFSARAEGFEQLTASVFGPKGPLNREVFRKKLSFLNRWLGNESSEEYDTLENLLNIDNLRLKRGAETNEETDTSDKIDPQSDDYTFDGELERKKRESPLPSTSSARKERIQKEVGDLGYKLKYNYNTPRAQVGFRIFGNDLRYYSMEGMLEVMALVKEFDPFHQASKILSGREVTYTKSSVLLDASYNTPLSIGIPLSIHTFGASSMDMRISGNLERMEPAASDWYFNVEGRFKPSVSVDIITTMQSDMFYALSGIKVKSNLYSNSEVEAKLKVRGKNLVSISFNLPQDTNEIFSARSELLVMRQNQEILQPGIEKRKSNSTCTWPVLNEAIGLEMCSHFSVPDLSNASDIYPSLLLSGPLNFSIVLTKSDLSAKKFLFEYQWDQQGNDSKWSLVFHTPGSTVKRLLVANVSTVPDAFNASVSFVNGLKTASAGCNYDGNPNYRRLDVFLDTNGNRSLNLNMELQRWQERTAWVYKPKMLLAINGVNVTGMVGTIRINEKNGITQNDIEMSFETRKLQVLMRGNVVQSEITTSTNMTINYRFQANKVETINFDGRLVNTGDKSKTEYRGGVKLKTSAYPKLNFASNATWLTLQGHTEGVFTYNNAPNFIDPRFTSLVRLVFVRSYSEDILWEGSRTRTSLEVKVPRSKIDFRILVKHEERNKNGTEHNVIVGFRYAPEKEATGLFSILLPRRSLFAVDAYMNVSIPDFNSCTVKTKITERALKDYIINFNGTWFTDHSISLRGNYKDRSSRVQSLHHVKLIVESPSFDTTAVKVIYRRNQLLIFADLQAKYANDPYGLTLQYTTNSDDDRNSNSEIRLKIKDKLYWINGKLLSQQPKLLQIEIHLDKLRDIHIKTGLISLDRRKELSLELKWDVNRDPSQRMGLLAEYNNPRDMKYDGNIMITYPDRTVSCGFDVYTGGPKYFGTARASWSINDMIVLNYDIAIMPSKNINNWVHIEVMTPFDGWHNNSLKAGVYNVGNLFAANSSLLWADSQKLELGYRSDFTISEPVLSFDVRFGINSTIKDIPTISVKVQHWQDLKKFDTDLGLRYTGVNDTLNAYSLKSNWELLQNEHFENVSGTVLMISPFEGYRKGGLAAKFSLSDQREIRGAASLTFDIRDFTLAINGYVKKFMDNMLVINITTPLDKFRTIHGRFGLNEKKRHAVAEVRATTAALGVEVLCDIKSLMNFDVRLSVATPIEAFQQAAIFAKVKPDTVDMRGKWNNITIGFTGVWRMNNLTDFEYSYYVYTPLHDFKENGFIAKLIKRDIFILNLNAKLSNYKLGIRINGHPKSTLLKQLGSNIIELETLYDDDFRPAKLEEEDYDFDDIDYEEFFSYFVEFELNTVVWPTIDGVVDIQEIMDYYLVIGNLQLPQGRVDMKNRLYYPDYLNILNVLTLNTPFPIARDVKAIVEYHVDLNFTYFYDKVHVIFGNNANDVKPKEIGIEVNYTQVTDTLKPREHNIRLHAKLLSEVLNEIDVVGKLELEDNIYRGNISSKTPQTFLSLAAAVEIEENFLETAVGIILNTTTIPHYACKAYFKKDYSKIDNSIDVRIEITDKDIVNRLEIESAWYTPNSSQIINANGRIKTTMLPLKLAECAILISDAQNPQLSFDLGFLNQNGLRVDYGTRAIKKHDVFNVEIWTPMHNYRNISLHGSLTPSPSRPGEYQIAGQLYRNMYTYGLYGMVRMDGNLPTETRLRVQPKTGGRDGVIELTINKLVPGEKQQHGFDFEFSAIEDGKMCQISGCYSFSDMIGMAFSMLVESTETDIAHININAKLQPLDRGRMYGAITLQTPWKELGIENVSLHTDIKLQAARGRIDGGYRIDKHVGRGSCDWSWIFEQDMQLTLENYMERPNTLPRIVQASIKYLNPNKDFQHVTLGGKLNVDSKWNLQVNGTINYRSVDDIQFGIISLLPEPIVGVHRLNAMYKGNLISEQGKNPNVFLEGKYLDEETQRKVQTRLTYINATNLESIGHVEWGVAKNTDVMEANFNMLRKSSSRREFHAKILTPKFKTEPTLIVNGSYDLSRDTYHNVICTVDYPASRRMADMNMAFKSLNNLYGHLNSTTPFVNVTWLNTNFNFSTVRRDTYRYCHAEWPSNFAFFKLHNIYDNNEAAHDLHGTIKIEVPLVTRHRADIEYELQERQHVDKGQLKVVYNEKQVLSGIYERIEEHAHPLYKDTTHITLDNEMKPLGIHYVSLRDWRDSENTKDIKHIEIFDLAKTEAQYMNLTGELHTRTTNNGEEIKLVVIHPNRTVVLTTHYEEVDKHTMHQKTKLQLSETAWIGYNIKISNYSTIGNDSQNFNIELLYPKRMLSTEGWYYMTDECFQSDMSFKWTDGFEGEDIKVVRTGLLWKDEPLQEADRDNQTIIFTLGHPYLKKDIVFRGNFYRGVIELLKGHFTVDYSDNPDHLIEIGAVLKDLRHDTGYTNYTLQFFAHHIASELDVKLHGTAMARPSYYKTESHAFYKRNYYPDKHGTFLALLDLNKKEIEYLRISPYRTVRVWILPNNKYPVYGLNATVWDSPDTNNTGYVYVDLQRKFTRAEVNLTEDASQNLQMVGYIPDSRSGYLDIWRNYEEIRIIDVTSYLKMNHSRLISGRFHWRPKIKDEVKEKIRLIGTSIYNSFSDGIDFWIKSLYSETVEAVGVIWETAKEYNSAFVTDIGQLSVLEEDLEDLRLFMNQSYEANDFYIKTVVNFTITILDELAIRDHIESLPKIFTEIWQAMGDSGKALRNSVMWLVETIKSGYNNLLDAIGKFFHGESLQYLAGLMEKGVEKYEKFIKDLHIKFIKYVENLWNKFWAMMSNYWKGVLKRIEPHIFKFMSYIETTAWDLSKEIFDFIYKRTNELAESPYFNKVSSFTQDVDRLYKDIKSHDAITNIKKYSMIAWNFIKEKYFKLVPFGAELNEVITEIWEEMKELQKIDQIQIVIQKYQEVMAKIEWVAEELQLEMRLHQIYALIRNKFRNYAMNALETADMYREAKTKFVYDPEVGVIDLEQKLPMSWYAFNETPKFEEIPEYKFIAQVQNIFTTTNSSILRYVYNLRTHLDPKTWLPPYYSRALLIDSRHYLTFDKRFVGLNLHFQEMIGEQRNLQCSYVLAHDFFQHNFTLMLEPSTNTALTDVVSARKLTLIANGQLLEIDLKSDTLTVNGDLIPMLPLHLHGVVVHRELDILSIHSENEFKLECNMQFDLCWFEVSGWYFGQTAGLLGTINNEPFDEYTSSKNIVLDETALEDFTDSWSTMHCRQKKTDIGEMDEQKINSDHVHDICYQFFKSGMLSSCVNTVSPRPFYEMCADLGGNSNPVRLNHPAIKGACTAALAYIEACTMAKIPMRVPHQCVFCQLTNGSFVPEGSFVELSGNDVPRSSDVVFIVEAKPCNSDLTTSKNIMSVVAALHDQLHAQKILNNRYAVIGFGGHAAPLEHARSITYGNRIFVDNFKELEHFFGHIVKYTTGSTDVVNNNNDILQAISTASKLNFRPGVSKTFILLSCSDCAARHMRFDYSSILQYMFEEGVNLHVLADIEFEFERTLKLRNFFGLDKELVYSKRFPEGDAETRRQLHIPKGNLGICTPLALETNGSVFSARKLLPERKNPVKRFITIFARRVAKSAVPTINQTCECSGHNSGVSYMACGPSVYPAETNDMEDYDLQLNNWEFEDEDNEM